MQGSGEGRDSNDVLTAPSAHSQRRHAFAILDRCPHMQLHRASEAEGERSPGERKIPTVTRASASPTMYLPRCTVDGRVSLQGKSTYIFHNVRGWFPESTSLSASEIPSPRLTGMYGLTVRSSLTYQLSWIWLSPTPNPSFVRADLKRVNT